MQSNTLKGSLPHSCNSNDIHNTRFAPTYCITYQNTSQAKTVSGSAAAILGENCARIWAALQLKAVIKNYKTWEHFPVFGSECTSQLYPNPILEADTSSLPRKGDFYFIFILFFLS